MIFEVVDPETIDVEQEYWLRQIKSVRKVNFAKMLERVLAGEWTLFRLPEPARGYAVGYAEEDRLFIYYLSGELLFGKVKSEDLINAARDFGCTKGMRAYCKSRAMQRILKSLGFVEVDRDEDGIEMDLADG